MEQRGRAGIETLGERIPTNNEAQKESALTPGITNPLKNFALLRQYAVIYYLDESLHAGGAVGKRAVGAKEFTPGRLFRGKHEESKSSRQGGSRRH